MAIFLKTKGTKILLDHQPVHLKGVNLGGWLLMEGYILHSRNVGQQVFKKEFKKTLGTRALVEFEKGFSDHFIKESDIKNIAQLGFNCIRVPFHHKLIEKKAYQYDKKGVAYLDRVVQWAKKNHIWVILDLHAACGCQNHDWHSDSLGKAELWQKKSYRNRAFALWEFLADRYKNETTVAGFDLLNEAVIANTKKLNAFYKGLIKTIRAVNQNHILFIEGNNWATDAECLDRFKDDNYVLSVHSYEPLDFTFNFVPHLSYPLRSWNKGTTKKLLLKHKKVARKHNVPVFVGEFGVNYRQGLYREDLWLKDTLALFKELGFHWTYWTYKAIKSSVFPDGVYSYMDNPPWVNRAGPKIGWETYSTHWSKFKKDMMKSWITDKFYPNKKVLSLLKNAAKNH